MPVPFQSFFEQPAPSPVRVDLEPAANLFQSLFLIAHLQEYPGVAEWVYETQNRMSKSERHNNELVVVGLHYAVVPESGWGSFPAYIDHIAETSPDALRDRMLDKYDRLPVLAGEGPSIPRAEALSSAGRYLDYLRQRFPAGHLDEELERRAYQMVMDPPAMQRLVVDHMRLMWNRYLSSEWERVRPMLQESVRAFRQIDWRGKSLIEAARQITEQELATEKWERAFASAKQVTFAPSAHIGPYLYKLWVVEEEPVILFGARLPKGSSFDAPDLSRTEAVVRLSALADDTRLRMLRYIAENGEQRSQEIMDALALSQSGTSRHLTQLTATGFLKERRCDGAKCYTINPERITDTLQAISNYLLIGERSRS